MQRINRKLEDQPNPEKLMTARGEQQREHLGDHYTIEARARNPKSAMSSGVCRVFVKLEKLGREIGVLQPWEQLA